MQLFLTCKYQISLKKIYKYLHLICYKIKPPHFTFWMQTLFLMNKQYYKLHVQKDTSVYIALFCLVNNFTLVLYFFLWVCLFIFPLHHVYMNGFFLYLHYNIQWCIFSCQIWVKNSIVICLHLVKVRIWTVPTFVRVWRTYILVIYETGNKL